MNPDSYDPADQRAVYVTIPADNRTAEERYGKDSAFHAVVSAFADAGGEGTTEVLHSGPRRVEVALKRVSLGLPPARRYENGEGNEVPVEDLTVQEAADPDGE